jgi:putative ATPase
VLSRRLPSSSGDISVSADTACRVTPELSRRVSVKPRATHPRHPMVDCPICTKAVKDARINEHIDSGCKEFLLEQEPQGTPNLGKAHSFFTPGVRKPPGSTQRNANPASSPLAPPSATQRIAERPKTPPPGTKRSFDEAADGQTNGEPQSPSAPKRARRLKAVEDAMPLAERMRPTSLDDVCGQELVGPGGILRGMVNEGKLPSMILWGRPGTGKHL